MTKICNICFTEKSFRDYSKNVVARDGLSPRCQTCQRKCAKKWYAQNQGRAAASMKSWRLCHREQYSEYKKKWFQENREAIAAYYKNRRHSDPTYHLIHSQRVRIRQAIKGLRKSARTTELIGCSAEFLRSHLESKFHAGMTWENYGLIWHVDHIRPCASFDLTDSAQQRACFHYTNLQPLWAVDNLRKGSKVLG